MRSNDLCFTPTRMLQPTGHQLSRISQLQWHRSVSPHWYTDGLTFGFRNAVRLGGNQSLQQGVLKVLPITTTGQRLSGCNGNDVICALTFVAVLSPWRPVLAHSWGEEGSMFHADQNPHCHKCNGSSITNKTENSKTPMIHNRNMKTNLDPDPPVTLKWG